MNHRLNQYTALALYCIAYTVLLAVATPFLVLRWFWGRGK